MHMDQRRTTGREHAHGGSLLVLRGLIPVLRDYFGCWFQNLHILGHCKLLCQPLALFWDHRTCQCIVASPICWVPLDLCHVALLLQVPICCVSCQPTTQTASTRHYRSPTCLTLASSVMHWHGDPPGCPPARTQPCWLSSSVRAGAWHQVEKCWFVWKNVGFSYPKTMHRSAPHPLLHSRPTPGR